MARRRTKTINKEYEFQKVAIYSRKSKFTGKGDSIGNQVEECKDYLRRKFDYYETIKIDVFEDEGYSGKNTKRPEFQRMMKCIENNEYDLVICYRLDRITRNTRDFINLKETLDRYGVKFISTKDDFNGNGPMGEAMMKMASIFAELERNIIAERIRDNMYELAKTGRWLGGEPPTGYTGDKIETISDDGKLRTLCKLKMVDDEIDMVKLIYKKFIELDSLNKVETYLRQNCINTKNNKKHTRHSIKKILSNPVYAIADEDMWDYFNSFDMEIYSSKEKFNGKYGITAYKKTEHENDEQFINDIEDWIVAVGAHKGIIQGKDWIKVQKMLYQNKSKAFRKQRSNIALLSGLLKCGECGDFMRPKTMTRTNKDGELVYYYMCETKEKTRKLHCQIKNINGNELDNVICEEIKKIANNDTNFFTQLRQAQKTISSKTNERSKKIGNLEKRIKENEKKIQNGINSIIDKENDGSSIFKHINARIEELENENVELKKQIEALKGMTMDYDSMSEKEFDILRELLNTFAESYETMSLVEKRITIRTFIKKIVWDGENIHIYFWGDDDGENIIFPEDDNNDGDTQMFPLGKQSKTIADRDC